MFSPGIVTPEMARDLNELQTQLDALASNVQSSPAQVFDRPWLKLTSRDATTGLYAWTEADKSTDGTFFDKPEGRSGTATWNPAKEMNDEIVTRFPWYVKGERAINRLGGDVQYDFSSSISARFPSLTALSTATDPFGRSPTLDLILPTTGTYSFSGWASAIGGPLFAQMTTTMSIVGGAGQGQCTSGGCFVYPNVYYTTPVDFFHEEGGNTVNRAGGTFFSGWAQTLVDNAVLRLTITDASAFPVLPAPVFSGFIEALLFL